MRPSLLLLALAAAVAALPPDRTVWSTMKPTGTTKAVKMVESGKPLNYVALEGDGATARLKGPTRLRISVRAHFAKDAADSLEVKLRVSMDGGDPKETKLKCKRSKTATFVDGAEGEVPASREELILDVPEGEHTFLAKTDVKACGAFAEPSEKKKILRTEMTPSKFSKAVEEIYQERERTWYFGTEEKPIELEVTGPTTLRVEAALNFDASMRTSLDWKLEASIDGTVAEEKAWKSSRSHTRSYPDEKSLVPGQVETLDVKVPEGRHKVELKPRGSASAAFRISMPTADLVKGGGDKK